MSSQPLEPRPRQYARQIIAKRTRVERNTALQEVPEHLRALTKRHCINSWEHPANTTRAKAQATHD